MENKKQKRVVVYLPEDDYRQLKSKLALMGLSVSEWFRRVIREFIAK